MIAKPAKAKQSKSIAKLFTQISLISECQILHKTLFMLDDIKQKKKPVNCIYETQFLKMIT